MEDPYSFVGVELWSDAGLFEDFSVQSFFKCFSLMDFASGETSFPSVFFSIESLEEYFASSNDNSTGSNGYLDV